MTFEHGGRTSTALRRIVNIRVGPFAALGFIVGIIATSIGMTATAAAILGRNAITIGATGQIFESVGAVFSGMAFIALVVTFLLQLDELRLQRQELENQREEMSHTQHELHRSAEAEIRTLHVELMKTSLADPDLMDVWPQLTDSLPALQTKKYAFANLIIQHHSLMLQLGVFDDISVRFAVRYLFQSPVIRDFWRTKAPSRESFVPMDSPEGRFYRIVDEIYCQYLSEEAARNSGLPPELGQKPEPNSAAN